MSAPADVPAPIKLEHRPDFGCLPHHLLDTSENTTLAYQSFPFLPGYGHISFEEQRIQDMQPPPPMATRQNGILTPSALRFLKAAHTGQKPLIINDAVLLE